MFDLIDPPKLHPRWQTPCFDNLGRLDWPCWTAVTCFGVRIGLRANDPGLLETLRGLLPADARPYRRGVVDHWFSAIRGGPVAGSRVRRLHLLYGNHARLARGHDLDGVLARFEPALRLVIAALAPRRVFVHAGAVAWKGRAIILPGMSFAGKTALVAELVRAGASYFSDEYAVLDAKGRVHPFAKPLSLRESGSRRQEETPVEALGGRAVRHPLPVGLVVMSTFAEGARWRPRTLSPGQGALAVLSNTVTARHAPARSLASIREVVAHAPVVKSRRGEAAEVAPAILRLLERRAGL